MHHHPRFFSAGILGLILLATISDLSFGHKLYDHPDHLWRPKKDEVYLQEVSTKIYTDKPVRSLANNGEKFYALIEDDIFSIQNDQLGKLAKTPNGPKKMETAGGKIWLLASSGFYRMDDEHWTKLRDLQIVDVALHEEKVMIVTKDEIYAVSGNELNSIKPDRGYYNNRLSLIKEDGTQLHIDPVRLRPIDQIESFVGMMMLLRGSEQGRTERRKTLRRASNP